jgi:hypothetical protein
MTVQLAQLTGIKMAQPSTERTTKMLRHILVNRMKMAASMPTKFTISCSDVDHSGKIHAKTPFPKGGGACFSSACFSFGAYTTLLYGRRNEKQMAMAAVIPSDEPNAATTELCANYRVVDQQMVKQVFYPGAIQAAYLGRERICQQPQQRLCRALLGLGPIPREEKAQFVHGGPKSAVGCPRRAWGV